VRYDADVAEAMLLMSWPTNVRGLVQVVRASASQSKVFSVVTLDMLSPFEPKTVGEISMRKRNATSVAVPDVKSVHELLRDRTSMQKYLELYGGNISHIARELGTTRPQVYRWLNRLGLSFDRSTTRQA